MYESIEEREAPSEAAQEIERFASWELEAMELQDEIGGELGDPRRCPRHPNVITSSPDGMHDGLCGECEFGE